MAEDRTSAVALERFPNLEKFSILNSLGKKNCQLLVLIFRICLLKNSRASLKQNAFYHALWKLSVCSSKQGRYFSWLSVQFRTHNLILTCMTESILTNQEWVCKTRTSVLSSVSLRHYRWSTVVLNGVDVATTTSVACESWLLDSVIRFFSQISLNQQSLLQKMSIFGILSHTFNWWLRLVIQS